MTTRIRNPYIVGTPIPNTAYFYGREEVLSFVQDTINPPQQRVVVLYGQRRVGKTSLLYELARQLMADYHPVYFDLMGQANRPLPAALHEIASKIADDLLLEEEPAPFHTPQDFRSFLMQVTAALGQEKPLLLLLDEFDDLSDEHAHDDAAAKTLFNYLRDLLHIDLPVAFVFVVGRRLTELPQNFQSILKQAPSRRVSYLSRDNTAELIVKPAEGILTYTPEALDAIYHLTSGHPYFTQLICFELFRAAVKNDEYTIRPAAVEAVLDKAMETGKGGLAWFWDGLPLAERFVMSAIAEISGTFTTASTDAVREILKSYDLKFLGMEVTEAPHLLVSWEILKETPEGYQFYVDLVRRWIKTEHPLVHAKREVENLVPRANRYFANAREAHQASDLEDAIGDYNRAVAANPFHIRAQLGLAQALKERAFGYMSNNQYKIEQQAWQDLQEARAAFARAYELDHSATKDSYVDFLDNLSTYSYSNQDLVEAIDLAEQAQNIEYSKERARRVQKMTDVLEKERQREENTKQRLRYGVMLTTLITAVVIAAIFVPWQELFGGAATTTDIPPAAEAETLILISDYDGSAELNLNPEANLELVLGDRFPEIRFERVNSVLEDEEAALAIGRELKATGVIWGWIAVDSIGTTLTLISRADETLFLSLELDRTAAFRNPTVTLDSDTIQRYTTLLAGELEEFNIADIAHQLSGHTTSASDAYDLARLELTFAPDRSHISQGDSLIHTAIAQDDFFEPLIFSDKRSVPVVFVPSGSFVQGREEDKARDLCFSYANPEECENIDFSFASPPHEVYISPFFIDKHEVTNGAYAHCVAEEACPPPEITGSVTRENYYFADAYKDYPVIGVSWRNGQRYCEWRGGRLPTEAEWEKAARWDPIETTRTFPWGNDLPDGSEGNIDDTIGDTTQAASFPAGQSAVGAYDLAGNLLEWTADWFDPHYYEQEGIDTDPPGPPEGNQPVIKGGMFGGYFFEGMSSVDPAQRGGHDPGANPVIGFRCAFDILHTTQ